VVEAIKRKTKKREIKESKEDVGHLSCIEGSYILFNSLVAHMVSEWFFFKGDYGFVVLLWYVIELCFDKWFRFNAM
jgi:hypothetical protein